MSCSENNVTSRRGNGYVIILILYILLAIILGGAMSY